METVVFSSILNGALLLVCVALLVSLCLSCGRGRNTYIHQVMLSEHQNDDYQDQTATGFRVVRPTPRVSHQTYITGPRTASNHAFPMMLNTLPVTSPEQPDRRPSFILTNDGDSTASYENRNSESDQNEEYVNDLDKPNYIEVLPDKISTSSKPTSQPSLSSDHNNEIYINVDGQSDTENYINMPEMDRGLSPGRSYESMESDDNGSTDYVNTSPK